MSGSTVHYHGSTKTHRESSAKAQEIIGALDALRLDPDTQAAITFSEIFPAIAAAKARGHSDQEVRVLLEAMGLKLHHATFRKLYKTELRVRNESGERFCCAACGQTLDVKEQRHTKKPIPPVDATDSSAEVAA